MQGMRRFALLLLLVLASLPGFAQKQWVRYRVLCRNSVEVARVADCPLELFSDNLKIGANDLAVDPKLMPELWKLRLPFTLVSYLPPPDAWKDSSVSDADDYRNQYLPFANMINLCETWRAANPNLVTREQIASGWNGNPVWAYRIYKQDASDVEYPKKNIVVIAGIHAREWISPSAGLNIMDRLIQRLNTTDDAFTNKLVDNCAITIIPEFNPDGYIYSWTTNRYWRKNRRNNGSSYGVDLNRNFSVGWGLNGGSSSTPSSDTYRGPAAFSEPETVGLKNFCARQRNLVGFIDLHSYSELVLYPWSYQTALCPDDAFFNSMTTQMVADMVASGGHAYTKGQTSRILYIASGTSNDYLYGIYGTKAIAMELRDTGTYGFVLPENQIIPTQDEVWAAFVSMVNRIL